MACRGQHRAGLADTRFNDGNANIWSQKNSIVPVKKSVAKNSNFARYHLGGSLRVHALQGFILPVLCQAIIVINTTVLYLDYLFYFMT